MLTKQTTPPRNPVRKRPAPARRGGWDVLQKLHRRDLILLTGVLALACVTVLTVMFLVLRYQPEADAIPQTAAVTQPGPQPTHTVSFVQVTGLSQYALVSAAAQSWAADAQLISANATWPKVISRELVGEPTTWTYRFYSPEKARLFFALVSPEGEVETIEHVVPVTLPPPPIEAGAWLIDSPAALAIWLDNGGAKVLGSNPGLEMVIQLRRVPHNPNPVWLVAGLNNQTEQIHTVSIDANQGIVTTIQPGS